VHAIIFISGLTSHYIIRLLGYFVDRIYPIELEIKDTTDTDRFASCLGLHLEVDSEEWLRTKQMVSIFPLWTFHLYVSTIQQHLHMEYISLSWYHIPEFVASIMVSLIAGCCLQGSYWTKGSSWLSWSHHFESFTVATMTWLTTMEYLCHKWPRICSNCRKHFMVLSSFMTYHRVCN
jgi:hypothetical protein